MKLLTLLLLRACLAPLAGGEKTDEPAASVNGSPIMLSVFRKEFHAAVVNWEKTGPKAQGASRALKELGDSTLERLIDREVLCQEGVKLKIAVAESDVDLALKDVGRRSFAADETGNPLTEAEAESRFFKELEQEGFTYEEYRKRLARQVLAKKVLEQEVKARVTAPSEKEVRAYFDKVARFTRSGASAPPQGMGAIEGLAFRDLALQIKELSSEQIRFSRILLKFPPGAAEAEKKKTLIAAEALKRRLDTGGSFADAAKAQSQDAESAPRGGDMGFATRNKILPEIAKVAFSLPVGATSAPMKSDLGYNLLRVTSKRAPEPPDFGKFKGQVAQFLANLNGAKETAKYLESLKAKAVIDRRSSLLAAEVSAARAALP